MCFVGLLRPSLSAKKKLQFLLQAIIHNILPNFPHVTLSLFWKDVSYTDKNATFFSYYVIQLSYVQKRLKWL